MEQGKRLVLNSVVNVGALLVRIAVALALTPFIVRELGKDVYGIWALVGSIMAYGSVLTFGLPSAVTRYSSKFLAEGRTEALNQYVNTALAAFAISGAAILLATGVLAVFLPVWFKATISPEMATTARIVFVLAGLGLALPLPASALGAVLTGMQRYELRALFQLAGRILFATLAVVLLKAGYRLVALAAVRSVSIALPAALACLTAMRLCPGYRFRLAAVRWVTFVEMVTFGVSSLAYVIGDIIRTQGGQVVIGALISAQAVTEFALPTILVGLLTAVTVAATQVMQPAISSLQAQGKDESVRLLYLLSVKYATMVILPPCVMLICYGPQIMDIWIRSPEGMGHSGHVLAILAAADMFRLVHVSAFYVVVGLGKHRVLGAITLTGSALSVVLGWALVKFFGVGVVGVACGFAIPSAVISIFATPAICCHAAGLRVRDEVFKAVLPATRACLPFLAFALGARFVFWPLPGNWAQLLTLAAPATAAVLIGWYFLGFDLTEKQRVARYLKGLLRRG